MPDGITVRGIPELQQNLKNFPKLLVMECFGKALSRAIAVIEAEVRVRAPEAESFLADEYGHLMDNISSSVTISADGQGGKARIDFGDSFWAMFVEYGHRMLSHSKGPTKTDAVQPHPFARPAFEASADRAVDVFVEEVQRFMNQGGSIAA